MAGILDWLAGLGNMLGAATYTRPQDIQAVRGLLPQSVDNALAGTFQSPTANDALGVLGGPTLGAIRAFHGSPYDFDKFDLSKIGTGEGAQAYGHGLYFAENPKVAEEYRRSLADWPTSMRELIGSPISDDAANTILRARAANPSDPARAAQVAQWGSQELRSIPKDQIANAIADVDSRGLAGRMYEVNINAEPQQFLDWDKPLSQQSGAVRDAISPTVNTVSQSSLINARRLSGDPTGQNIYSSLGTPFGRKALTGQSSGFSDKANSTELLSQIGIPGIKYLDQGSRSAGTGTSNYVVFNPGLIDIIRKYGIAAGVSPLAAYAAAQQNQQ